MLTLTGGNIAEGQIKMAGSSGLSTDAKNALKTWEVSNGVEAVNSVDDIYRYDAKQQQDISTARPWEKV